MGGLENRWARKRPVGSNPTPAVTGGEGARPPLASRSGVRDVSGELLAQLGSLVRPVAKDQPLIRGEVVEPEAARTGTGEARPAGGRAERRRDEDRPGARARGRRARDPRRRGVAAA